MHTETSLLQTKEFGYTQDAEADNGTHAALVEALRKEIAQGFLDSHARSNKNAAKALEIASFSYALIELLQERGCITFEELDERKKVVSQRLVKKFSEQGMGVIALQDFRISTPSRKRSKSIVRTAFISVRRPVAGSILRYQSRIWQKALSNGI